MSGEFFSKDDREQFVPRDVPGQPEEIARDMLADIQRESRQKLSILLGGAAFLGAGIALSYHDQHILSYISSGVGLLLISLRLAQWVSESIEDRPKISRKKSKRRRSSRGDPLPE